MESDHNPMQKFRKWFYEADELFCENEANAMALVTVGNCGFPKSRMVLLKKYTWEGFYFFSNYDSEKGKSIQLTPEVGLLFNWPNSKRKIYVKGKAEKISSVESENYFQQRPLGSQLGAWSSNQSQVISSSSFLEEQFKAYELLFKNKTVPKPDNWGGYLVKPISIEFEQTHDSLFDRETYILNSSYIWEQSKAYFFNSCFF